MDLLLSQALTLGKTAAPQLTRLLGALSSKGPHHVAAPAQSNDPIRRAGFRDRAHYEANLAAARRMRNQERGMRSEGEASTVGDNREATVLMRKALELDASRKLSASQRAARSQRTRGQARNGGAEGQQSPFSWSEYTRDAFVQTPQFMAGYAKGNARAAVDFGKGVVQTVRHPIAAASGLVDAVAHPLRTAGQVAKWGNEQQARMNDALDHGDVFRFGEQYGHTSGTIAANAAGGQVINRAAGAAMTGMRTVVSSAASKLPGLGNVLPWMENGAAKAPLAAKVETPVPEAPVVEAPAPEVPVSSSGSPVYRRAGVNHLGESTRDNPFYRDGGVPVGGRRLAMDGFKDPYGSRIPEMSRPPASTPRPPVHRPTAPPKATPPPAAPTKAPPAVAPPPAARPAPGGLLVPARPGLPAVEYVKSLEAVQRRLLPLEETGSIINVKAW